MSHLAFQVDAFTRQRFAGNPAGVVLDADDIDDGEMQAIARELNNSETAFVLSADAPDHEVRLRYFTPTMEVPSCGHATVAAHYVRALRLRLPTGTVTHKIGIGVLPVEIIRDDDGDYRVYMTQGDPDFHPALEGSDVDEVLEAVRLEAADLDSRCPVQFVTTGSPKLMVGVGSREILDRLEPDPARLVRLGGKHGNNGLFAFTLRDPLPGLAAHGRMFAPQIGIPEDPVTGNGSGPLGCYLVEHGLIEVVDGRADLHARQGEAIGRPGEVHVRVSVEDGRPVRVQAGGHAVIAFETRI